jgi:hypothetical protein
MAPINMTASAIAKTVIQPIGPPEFTFVAVQRYNESLESLIINPWSGWKNLQILHALTTSR